MYLCLLPYAAGQNQIPRTLLHFDSFVAKLCGSRWCRAVLSARSKTPYFLVFCKHYRRVFPQLPNACACVPHGWQGLAGEVSELFKPDAVRYSGSWEVWLWCVSLSHRPLSFQTSPAVPLVSLLSRHFSCSGIDKRLHRTAPMGSYQLEGLGGSRRGTHQRGFTNFPKLKAQLLISQRSIVKSFAFFYLVSPLGRPSSRFCNHQQCTIFADHASQARGA